MFCGCFMDWLIVFIAKMLKEPKLRNVKLVSCYNGAFETKWFSKLLELFCMNYKMFKMKIKILINPWKSIFAAGWLFESSWTRAELVCSNWDLLEHLLWLVGIFEILDCFDELQDLEKSILQGRLYQNYFKKIINDFGTETS